MPFTFSHPAAVLPLRRLGPLRLDLAALVLGSITPDLGYYVGQFEVATYAHTARGVVLVCLPTGLLLLAVFFFVRARVCFLLPQPHRGALRPLCAVRPSLNARTIGLSIVAVLLGAWSHTLWDSFTHENGWSVQRLPWLRTVLFTRGGFPLTATYLLQQLSSMLGAAVLLSAYLRWLRKQPAAQNSAAPSDRPRYFLWAAMILFAFIIAVPTAGSVAATFGPSMVLRVFVFRLTVHFLAILVPLIIITALIVSAAPNAGREEL